MTMFSYFKLYTLKQDEIFLTHGYEECLLIKKTLKISLSNVVCLH